MGLYEKNKNKTVPIQFYSHKYHKYVTNLETETAFLADASIFRKLFMIATKFHHSGCIVGVAPFISQCNKYKKLNQTLQYISGSNRKELHNNLTILTLQHA